MNIKKQATKDAAEFAAAEMAFGDGAGIRRRLVQASITHRINNVPGYADAFYKATSAENMVKHAKNAQRIHTTKTVTKAVNRNVRGILTGDIRSVNTSVIVIIGGAYFAHRYGWDKKAAAKIKETYHKVEDNVKARMAVNDIMKGK